MSSAISRPPGLVVVVTATAILAVLGILLYGISLLALANDGVDGTAKFVITFGFAFSIAIAVAAHRLWYFQPWAVRLAQIVYVIQLIWIVIAIAGGYGSRLDFFIFILLVWMLFYVSKRSVRALYADGPPAVPDGHSKASESSLQSRDRFFS